MSEGVRPEPRIDENGTPKCQQTCPLYVSINDPSKLLICRLEGPRQSQRLGEVCQPQARADAAELAALRGMKARAIEVRDQTAHHGGEPDGPRSMHVNDAAVWILGTDTKGDSQ